MIEKLKPCPFCGGDAMIFSSGTFSPAYKIFCLTPSCDGQYGWCVSKEEAVNGWNRRAGENHEHDA